MENILALQLKETEANMTKCKLSFGFPALSSVNILVISYLFDAISLVEIMSCMDEWTEFCNLIIIMSKMHTCGRQLTRIEQLGPFVSLFLAAFEHASL